MTLTILVGMSLIGGGITRALQAFKAANDQRAAALFLGLASIILGIVALGWPDITLLIVAVVFGVRMVLFGFARLYGTRRKKANTDPSRSVSSIYAYTKTIGAVIALVASLALAALSIRLHQASPTVDTFYTAPDQVPDQPGVLLRAEPLNRALPDGAQGWRILYTTTCAEGVPALASALVVAPKILPPGPRPVIA